MGHIPNTLFLLKTPTMVIKYDTPIEVTEKQYRNLMEECDGVVAGRIENGKYYIKVWLMKYVDQVNRMLGR